MQTYCKTNLQEKSKNGRKTSKKLARWNYFVRIFARVHFCFFAKVFMIPKLAWFKISVELLVSYSQKTLWKSRHRQLWPIFTTPRIPPTVSGKIFLESLYSLVYVCKFLKNFIDAFRKYSYLKQKKYRFYILWNISYFPLHLVVQNL